MKLKNKITKVGIIALASLTLTVGVAAAAASSIKPVDVSAYSPSTHYSVSDTASELASYYSSISDSDTGTSLLGKLRTLNSSKHRTNFGYSSLGTSASSSPYSYTDYPLGTTTKDSNGQVYSSNSIASFYTKTTSSSFNKEHVWPNSRGGGYVDDDVLMPRPTISSENSSRGNSFFVEGMNHSSNGWDPYTAGYDAEVRGECARIIFYCMVSSSSLNLIAENTLASSASGYATTMGNMHTLIDWHYQYSPNQYEINRNNGAEYLQGNRNPFVDHPEYVAKIWGNFDTYVANQVSANESSMYGNWTPGSASSYGSNDAVDAKLTISASTKSMTIDETDTISATSSNSSAITWTTSNSSVVSISSGSAASGANITLTAKAEGTATITAKATIDGSSHTKTCVVTVSTSGGSGSGDSGQTTGDATITIDDLDTSYPTSKDYTTSVGNLAFNATNVANFSSKIQFKKSGGNLYNTESLNLDSITINGLSGSLTVYGGTSLNPSSTAISSSSGTYDLSGYNYFKIINSSSSVATCSSISVTLGSGGSTTTKTLSYIYLGGDQTTEYYVGDTFSFTGTCYAVYTDGSNGSVTPTSVSSPTMTSAGTKTVTVSYTEGGVTKSTTYDITVSAKTLSSLAKSGTLSKTSYYAGESFDYTGLTFTATFSDSSTLYVSSQVTFSPSPLTAGTTSVTASYTYGGTTKTVTVSGLTVVTKTLQSLSKTGTPSKTSYDAGESFNASGLTVTATFNGGTEDVTSSVVWTPSPLTTGTTSVTGTYTYSGVSKTVTVSGITVSEVQETYHVTLTTSNDNLSTSALTSDSTLSYSILNSSDVASGSNMNITWSTGCKNTITTNYSEVTIPNGSSLTPGDNTEVKSILIDWYHGSDNATVKADGVTITGASTTLSGSSGVPTLYTFSSATSNWSIAGSNSSYNANAYSITFEITGLPQTVAATGVTLTPQASSIAVGGTATLTANVLPSNASNKTVTWSSNKTSVATVSNGVVTGVAAGSATITVTTEDGGYTATCLVSVIASSGYTIVNSDLPSSYPTSGTEYTAASGLKFVPYNVMNQSSKVQFKKSGSYLYNNSAIENLSTISINGGSGTLTVYAGTSKNPTSTSIQASNGSYNLSGYTYFTIKNTTSNAITCTSISIMTSSASSTGYSSDDFASDFINALTCDANGNTAPTLSTSWSELKALYNTISSSEEKAKLTNATYSISGSGSSTVVTATGTTTEVVALAMSRYDILISKYSSTYSDNFIGRPASAQQNLFITQTESSTTMMIVIVSIISISAISGFIFLKKRKETN